MHFQFDSGNPSIRKPINIPGPPSPPLAQLSTCNSVQDPIEAQVHPNPPAPSVQVVPLLEGTPNLVQAQDTTWKAQCISSLQKRSQIVRIYVIGFPSPRNLKLLWRINVWSLIFDLSRGHGELCFELRGLKRWDEGRWAKGSLL